MDSRVTSSVAPGRAESGRGEPCRPDTGSASGRTAVTKADEGVAPSLRGAAQIVTPGSSGNVGTVDLPHELVRGQLSEYLDGSLGEDGRRGVDAHLSSCRTCAAYLATLRQTVRALGELPAAKAPPGARRKILEQGKLLEQARRESEANQ